MNATNKKQYVSSWKGRKIQGQVQVSIKPSWSPVSRWSHSSAASERKLRPQSWSMSSCISSSCDGVSCSRDFRAGWQCCQGQQEEPDNPETPPTGHQKRRRVEQVAIGRDHCSGRRPPEHPGRAAAKEEPEWQQGLFGQPGVLRNSCFTDYLKTEF